jgi:hypothetical protein
VINEVQENLVVGHLVIADHANKPRTVVGCSPMDGAPFVQLLDDTGLTRLELSLQPEGAPHVSLFSTKNALLGSFGLDQENSGAGLTLWSANGACSLNIGVSDDGFVERVAGFTTGEQDKEPR